jgi:tetratricopeptide (TPR) repeat protein
MGDANLAVGAYDQALNNYKSAYTIDADSAYYYFKCGKAYVKLNNGEKTAEMYKKLKNLKSEYAERLMNYKYYPKTRD